MGMSPVPRAFLILLVAAAVVAVGLLFAQDQVTLALAQRGFRGGFAASRLRCGAGRHGTVARQRVRRAHQRRPDLSGDARSDRRGAAPHQLRDLHLRYRRGRDPLHGRARASGAAWRYGQSRRRRGRRRLDGERAPRATAPGRLPCRAVQRPRLVLARGNQLSNAPQDSRRRWRNGVHRRRRHRRSLARQRRLEGALARYAGACSRAGGADDGGRLLRELPGGRRDDAARSRPGAAIRRHGRGGARRAQLAERRQQRSEAALPAGARRGEAQRSTSPRRTSSPTSRRSGRSRMPSGAA